jgi:endonuclease-3
MNARAKRASSEVGRKGPNDAVRARPGEVAAERERDAGVLPAAKRGGPTVSRGRRGTGTPGTRDTPATDKSPFDIDDVMDRVRTAVAPQTPAAMFQLYDEGFRSVFEILVSCVISIRTTDEATLPVSRKLFAVARTPPQVSAMTPEAIDELIAGCTFHGPKSRTIHDIATLAVDRYGDGDLPCDFDVLTGFRGVGPKCANLVLGVACQQPHGVAVDVHVHRVTNRWGYVAAAAPEKTMAALEAVLPKPYWIEINKLLVPFGKHVCTGVSPKCSACPVLSYCRQVGVTTHR